MGDVATLDNSMEIGGGILLAMTLKALIELDVLEIMVAAGLGAWLSPEEIASKIHSRNPDAHEVLDRMIRFLAAHKVVTCEVVVVGEDGQSERRYGLGPVWKFFTKDVSKNTQIICWVIDSLGIKMIRSHLHENR